jgi:hypothetical protein
MKHLHPRCSCWCSNKADLTKEIGDVCGTRNWNSLIDVIKIPLSPLGLEQQDVSLNIEDEHIGPHKAEFPPSQTLAIPVQLYAE